jgi:hypothetical protein
LGFKRWQLFVQLFHDCPDAQPGQHHSWRASSQYWAFEKHLTIHLWTNATNIELKTNFSIYTADSDGNSVSGSAASVLTEINTYLATVKTNAPSGPVSVSSQTTTVSASLTVQGAVTLLAGETLTVVVNRVDYSGANVTNCSGQTLTAPHPVPPRLPLHATPGAQPSKLPSPSTFFCVTGN